MTQPVSTAVLKDSIESGAMTPFQIIAVSLCIVLNMLDGFDVLVMAFTASDVAKHWSLSAGQLGMLLSAGLVGMAAGSLFVAPYADHFGRRALILFCLILITAGMLLSAVAASAMQLAALRALTGIGIGGILASLNVITGEYSSGKWRSAAISLQVTGYPIGATIGGIIAAWLMVHFGWRAVFAFGGIASGVLIPVVWWSLPESFDYLLARRPPNALAQLNVLLRKMKRPQLTALPPAVPGDTPTSTGVKSLFSAGLTAATLRIWTGFFMVMLSFYFVLSWTPRLLVTAGMSTQQGVTGGVLLNIGGIIGGSLFAWWSVRRSLISLSTLYMVSTAIALVAYALFAGALQPAFVIALVVGVVIFGSMAALYAMAPLLYPAAIRTTGMGWSIGIGRIGAILAPITAGLLLDGGIKAPQLYFVFALPMLIAMWAVRGLPVK